MSFTGVTTGLVMADPSGSVSVAVPGVTATVVLVAGVGVVGLPSGSLTRPGAGVNPLIPLGVSGSIDDNGTGPQCIAHMGLNDWRMWYEASYAGNSCTCAYATSTDGLTWTKVGTVLAPLAGGSWEGGNVGGTSGEISPDTMMISSTSLLGISPGSDGNVYKLWYHSYGLDGHRRIGYAESPNGTSSWTRYASNPVIDVGVTGQADEKHASDCRVFLLLDGTYRMYYGGTRTNGNIFLCYATSTDGLTWTKQTGLPATTLLYSFSSTYSSFPAIMLSHGIWHIWAEFVAGTGAMQYLYSPDGLTWTRANASVLTKSVQNGTNVDCGAIGRDMFATVVSGVVYVYYKGSNYSYTGNAQGRTEAVCVATITDPLASPAFSAVGVTASIALVPPLGSIQFLFGVSAAVVVTAPPGTVSISVIPVTCTTIWTALPGLISTALPGVVATSIFGAPAGSFSLGSSLVGVTPDIPFVAPPGNVSVTSPGVTIGLTITAPAGSVTLAVIILIGTASASTGAGSATNLSVVLPLGIQANDLILIGAESRVNPTFTTPSLYQSLGTLAQSNHVSLALFSRQAVDSSDSGASVNVAINSTRQLNLVARVYRNVNVTTLYTPTTPAVATNGVTQGTGLGSGVTSPTNTLTPSTSGAMLVGFVAAASVYNTSGTLVATLDTGTNMIESHSTAASNVQSGIASTELLQGSAAAATWNYSATLVPASTGWFGVAILIGLNAATSFNVGVTSTISVTASAGSVSTTLTGVVSPVVFVALVGSVSNTLPGTTAVLAVVSPVGAVGVSIVGVTTTVIFSPIVGVISTTSSGIVATIIFVAPAGSFIATAPVFILGVTAGVVLVSPAGVIAVTSLGVTSIVAISAPLGSLIPAILGPTVPVVLGAPSGLLSVTSLGVTAVVNVGAPSGAASVTISGVTVGVVISAPVGAVFAASNFSGVGVTTGVVINPKTGVIGLTLLGITAVMRVDALTGLESVALLGVSSAVVFNAPSPSTVSSVVDVDSGKGSEFEEVSAVSPVSLITQVLESFHPTETFPDFGRTEKMWSSS